MSNNKILWTPKETESTNIHAFMQHVNETHQLHISSYEALHSWSVDNLSAFWTALWRFCGVVSSTGPGSVALDETCPMRDIPKWFPEARLNFAENLLKWARVPEHRNQVALISCHEDDAPSHFAHAKKYTFGELEAAVAQLAGAFRSHVDLRVSDSVGAFIPNCDYAVIGALAAASCGARYSTTAPDFGAKAVLDRLGQVHPRVLLCGDSQIYRGKRHDLTHKIGEIAHGLLPSLEHVVVFPFGHDGLAHVDAVRQHCPASVRVWSYDEFVAGSSATEIRYEQLPMDHPLYVLFTSGTTGSPKCLIHSAGGTLLKHLCEDVLHVDLRPGDSIVYYTTTAWMMFHWLVSCMVTGATVICYDGSPFNPSPAVLFDICDSFEVTHFGTSAKYILSLEDAKYIPRNHHSLKTVRSLLSTGSPLMPESFDYVYNSIKEDVHLASITGGTDILGCFAGGCPLLPVRRSEIQCRLLGMAVEALDPVTGEPCRDRQGELVCTKPFPSMPVEFGSDPQRAKYHASYFSLFGGGIWCHGDWIQIDGQSGGIIMYGRSDATLNPGGVRFGSAELYNVMESKFSEEVADSVVVAQRLPRGDDERVLMFVKMKPGVAFDADLSARIKTAIRSGLSARHVPAVVVPVGDIPYTVNGKKIEVAVKRVLHGEYVAGSQGGALANPEALDLFRNIPEVHQF